MNGSGDDDERKKYHKNVLDIDAICPLYKPAVVRRDDENRDKSERRSFDSMFPVAADRRSNGRPFLMTHSNSGKHGGLQKSILVRLKHLEEVRRRNKELIATQKKEIRILRDAVKNLEAVHSESSALDKIQTIDSKLKRLRRENEDMHQFLKSQGLRWVRNDDDEDDRVESCYTPLAIEESASTKTKKKRNGAGDVMKGKNLSSSGESVDIEKFVQGMKQLNIVVDRLKVKDGRYQRVSTVPVTVFADGLFLYRGPFRSFADRTSNSTRRFVDECSNGYVPSEFETKFPDGVQFQVLLFLLLVVVVVVVELSLSGFKKLSNTKMMTTKKKTRHAIACRLWINGM